MDYPKKVWIYWLGNEGRETPTFTVGERIVKFEAFRPIQCDMQTAVRLLKRPGMKSIKQEQLYEHMEYHHVQSVIKTLIIRDEGIGDVLLTTPAVKALKIATGAKISYATNPNYAILLECNPYIDEVLDLTKVSAEKKRQFSTVADLRYCSEHSPERDKVHRIHTYCERTDFPIPEGQEDIILKVPERVLARGRDLIGFRENQRYIALNMSATHYCRNWDDYKFEMIARHFTAKGYQVVVVDKQEVPWQWKGIINLSAKTTVEDMVGVIANMDLLIGVDSAGYHIAGALGIPFVALFGIISPQLRTTYYKGWHRDLHADIPCIGCGNFHMDRCKKSNSNLAMCMVKLLPEPVIKTVEEYFDSSFQRVVVEPSEIHANVNIAGTNGQGFPAIIRAKKLTLAMIVMNEELCMPRIIENLFDDHRIKRIVVIDGGSTDGTVDLLKKTRAEVYVHPYLKEYHEQQAMQRNISMSYIPEGEHVLILDADELASPQLKAALQDLAMRREPYICLPRMTFRSWGGTQSYLKDGNTRERYLDYPDWQSRIYTMSRYLKFYGGPHHKTLGVGEPYNVANADILHYERPGEEHNAGGVDRQWKAMVKKAQVLNVWSAGKDE